MGAIKPKGLNRKQLHDCIISLREDVWAHKTSLTLSLFIEVPVSSQESEQSCTCVSILSLSTLFLLDFKTVPTVWIFLVFHFINVVVQHVVSLFSNCLCNFMYKIYKNTFKQLLSCFLCCIHVFNGHGSVMNKWQ